MQLQLTDEQFKELVFLTMIGEYVRGGVLDSWGEYDPQKHNALMEYLLQEAAAVGRVDLVEKFEGHLVPSDALSDEEEELMVEYNDDEFWSELSSRLGQRDFEASMTADEKREAEAKGWLPERVQEFYEKYEKEFEEHGVERLRVIEESSVTALQ